VSDFELGLALFGGLSLILGLLTRWLKQSYFSENILALLIGVLVGPVAFGWIDLADWGDQHLIIERVAEIALAIALMEIALRLPKREFLHHLKSYVILLGALMPLMWLSTGLLVWLLLDLPFWVSMLIGAILTPTDPIVASSVVTGPVAERYLPTRLRDTLWAESGANDGLAYPFVALALLVVGSSFSDSVGEWIYSVILYETAGAAIIGAAIGYGAAQLLMWAESRHTIENQSFRTFTLALSITTLGVTALAGTKGLLGVFVAGIIFHMVVGQREDEEVEPTQGALDHFFTIPVFALIGITIPLSGWLDLGWPAIVLVVGVILLRRLPTMLLVSRWVGPLRTWPDALFIGWFGPLGIGALYYAAYVVGETGDEDAWMVASLVICASIVIHGMTATPLSYLYASRTRDQEYAEGRDQGREP
jgi:sodium/hydrogen antiporter